MTQEEWDAAVEKWANKDILEKVHGKWVLKKEYDKRKNGGRRGERKDTNTCLTPPAFY